MKPILISNETLSDIGRVVLQALCEGPVAWRTPAELAADLGWKLDTTCDVLADLDVAGWIAVWERPERSGCDLDPAGRRPARRGAARDGSRYPSVLGPSWPFPATSGFQASFGSGPGPARGRARRSTRSRRVPGRSRRRDPAVPGQPVAGGGRSDRAVACLVAGASALPSRHSLPGLWFELAPSGCVLPLV